MKKLLPLILLLVGLGAGGGAGLFLRPAPPPPIEDQTETETEPAAEDKSGGGVTDEEASDLDYVKLSNQFVVPVVRDKVVVALVVLALSLEVSDGSSEEVFSREPKLRDSFLQVLFDHANVGGFDGAFTEASNLAALRRGLREAGQKEMGKDVIKDVLILEIARQDY